RRRAREPGDGCGVRVVVDADPPVVAARAGAHAARRGRVPRLRAARPAPVVAVTARLVAVTARPPLRAPYRFRLRVPIGPFGQRTWPNRVHRGSAPRCSGSAPAVVTRVPPGPW